MRIHLHIGLPGCGPERVQSALSEARGALARQGVLYPKAGGGGAHTRVYMGVSDPDAVDALRAARGLAEPGAQDRLRRNLAPALAEEAKAIGAREMILSSQHFATLHSRAALERLKALLAPISEDIRITAHLDEQARVLTRHYEQAVMSGRTAPLSQELDLAAAGGNWRKGALADWEAFDPARMGHPDVQAPPFWLDYTALQGEWEAVFGPGSVRFRAYSEEVFAGPGLADELRAAFGIEGDLGKITAAEAPARVAAATLARARQLNAILVALLDKGRVIPRPLWRRFLNEVEIAGAPTAPGSLSAISAVFEADNRALVKAHPALTADALKRDRKCADWHEAEPGQGYRASQYAAAFLPAIENATRETRKVAAPAANAATHANGAMSPQAEKLLPPRAKENFANLRGGRFEPHNRLGMVNEEALAGAYTAMAPRTLPAGSSGRVIVGCMKNEAPYILEWVAYHRAIGVDNFIIYTNGCTDGTDKLLDRLQEMGVLQHRNNDDWKGNSPQQYALNRSLKEDVIRNAEWVIHIDVDEFINIRCGNGTLDDFFARVPDATNVAMTWRLFGHNGVTKLKDELVIEQFDTAAPKYCPKPHTVWGFKTMVKNVGAYGKLSCHRPNKLVEDARDRVVWVNGSGEVMSETYKEKGWRSDVKTVGYDLLQLNHYALRSAESFLVKRQRGRALHVDRSIGLNYWIRMDWSDHKDITIKRNIPRVRAELERLKQDNELLALHEAGLAWHKAKAEELHGMPEFQELYEQALETRLTELERVAFALALDMES